MDANLRSIEAVPEIRLAELMGASVAERAYDVEAGPTNLVSVCSKYSGSRT